MAIIRTSALVGAISGSYGSSVFANTRGGTIIRPRPLKLIPTSADQLAQAVTLNRITKQWQALSSGLQAKWRTEAANVRRRNRLGVARQSTGFSLYVEQNLQFNSFGTTLEVTEPELINTDDFDIATLVFSEGGPYNVVLVGTPAPSAYRLLIFGSRSFRITDPPRYRNRKRIVAGATTLSTINVFSAWEAALGSMPADEFYRVDVRIATTNGLYSRMLFGTKAVL